MENINWANVFASRAKELEDKKKSKTQSNEDWLKYLNDFLNGFKKVNIN